MPEHTLLPYTSGFCSSPSVQASRQRGHINSAWARWLNLVPMCRCMCGAPSCRGTMDTQPERFRDEGRRVEVWWDGEQAFFRGTVKGYSAKQQKHIIDFDDGEKDRIKFSVGPCSTDSSKYQSEGPQGPPGTSMQLGPQRGDGHPAGARCVACRGPVQLWACDFGS